LWALLCLNSPPAFAFSSLFFFIVVLPPCLYKLFFISRRPFRRPTSPGPFYSLIIFLFTPTVYHFFFASCPSLRLGLSLFPPPLSVSCIFSGAGWFPWRDSVQTIPRNKDFHLLTSLFWFYFRYTELLAIPPFPTNLYNLYSGLGVLGVSHSVFGHQHSFHPHLPPFHKMGPYTSFRRIGVPHSERVSFFPVLLPTGFLAFLRGT